MTVAEWDLIAATIACGLATALVVAGVVTWSWTPQLTKRLAQNWEDSPKYGGIRLAFRGLLLFTASLYAIVRIRLTQANEIRSEVTSALTEALDAGPPTWAFFAVAVVFMPALMVMKYDERRTRLGIADTPAWKAFVYGLITVSLVLLGGVLFKLLG